MTSTHPSQPGTRSIRIFISSTFRDMQTERELLIKTIFPRLKKICQNRQVNIDEVDLRWGIPVEPGSPDASIDQEAALENKVLQVCFDEIEKCRTAIPVFIGILSGRAKPRQNAQCDVPSERVILFHTLYLPTGLLMGRRLTSLRVCRSTTEISRAGKGGSEVGKEGLETKR